MAPTCIAGHRGFIRVIGPYGAARSLHPPVKSPEARMEPPEIVEWKTRERRSAAERRARAVAATPDAGARLAGQVHDAVRLPRGTAVSGYWPLEGELDIRPLLHQIHEMGHPIGLPVVQGKGLPLLFRHWS